MHDGLRRDEMLQKKVTSDERRQNDKTWHIVKEYKQKRDDICQKIQETKEALQIAKGNLVSLRKEKRTGGPIQIGIIRG
jgi:hypothetical protein